jgi:peptide/nickel transport system substrate-binding protein
MNQRLFGGRQPPAKTFVNPLDWVYAEELEGIPYDPTRATSLLDELGFRPGPDGIRIDAQGRALRFEIVTTAGNRSRELVQQVIQSQWRKIGVDAVLKAEPPRVLFGDTLDHRRFPHFALYAWISSPENPPQTGLHSTSVPNAVNGWSGQNYAGYANPRVDELIDAIEVELDREKRWAMWHELQSIYLRDLLYYRADAHIWPRWLEGVEPTGHLAPVTLWIERWRVREGS